MDKNLKYFLIFLLPSWMIVLFVHEIGHASTAYFLGARAVSIKFFQGSDVGYTGWAGLSEFNDGLALFFGPFSTFLLSILLLLVIPRIKNVYLKIFAFIVGVIAPLDFISYSINGMFGLRQAIFIGSQLSMGEPQRALRFMGLQEIFAPILAFLMLDIYFPYVKIYKKIKWK